MKLDRRRFLGSSVGVAATVGMTAEWAWPKHSVSYRRPRSAVAVLNADEYSEKIEALLLDGLRLFVSFRQGCVNGDTGAGIRIIDAGVDGSCAWCTWQ